MGLRDDTADILANMCEAAELWEGPFIIVSDFNTTTTQIQQSRVTEAIGAKVVAHSSTRGTCVVSSRTIGFFLVSAGLDTGIEESKNDFVTRGSLIIGQPSCTSTRTLAP